MNVGDLNENVEIYNNYNQVMDNLYNNNNSKSILKTNLIYKFIVQENKTNFVINSDCLDNADYFVGIEYCDEIKEVIFKFTNNTEELIVYGKEYFMGDQRLYVPFDNLLNLNIFENKYNITICIIFNNNVRCDKIDGYFLYINKRIYSLLGTNIPPINILSDEYKLVCGFMCKYKYL